MIDNPTTLRIIRMKELVSKVGYARSTIYALIKEGHFPEPFKLVPNGRANGWFEKTIDKWMQDRANTTKGQNIYLEGDN